MTGRRSLAVCAAAYVAITIAYSWPLPMMMGSGVAHDPYDPLLNAWILWWSTKAIPLTAAWWNAPFFYPAPGVLAFSEHLLGLAPLSAPVIVLTRNALAGYNVALLASYALCALSAHFLAYTLTRRHDVSFLAGLAYGFAPYRLVHLAHIQVVSSYWIPFCLAALHRFDRTGSRWWAAAAAAAGLAQSYANGYYMFFLVPLLVFWLLWHALGRWSARQWATVAVAFGVAGLLIMPVLLGYQRILRGIYGFSRSIGEIRLFSADAAGLLYATNELAAWGWLHVIDRPESNIFPGLTIVALAAFAIWHADPFAGASDDARWMRRLRFVAGIAALLAAVATVIPLVHGPWRLTIAGARILSIARGDKPATLGLIVAFVWIWTFPRMRAAYRRRSPLAFYAFAAFTMWLFALGPDPTIFNERALYQAPYGWLMRLPAFSGLRVPARFWMLAIACLAAVAALAANRLSNRTRRVVIIVAAAGFLVDGWPREFIVTRVEERRPAPAGIATRLDLPTGDPDAMAMYQQTLEGRPLVNGYSGYFPPHYYALRELLAAHDTRVLRALSASGPLGIVVDHAGDGDGAFRRWLTQVPGATTAHVEGTWSSYRIERQPWTPPPDLSGRVLPIKAVDSYPSPPHAVRAIDGDLKTRWSGGVQQQSAGYSVELSEPSHVGQLVLYLGEYVTDFPRKLRIEVSSDGHAWESVFVDDTAIEAYYAALRHPREVPMVFPIDRDSVRFIRLAQLGFGTHDWSIAEIEVRG